MCIGFINLFEMSVPIQNRDSEETNCTFTSDFSDCDARFCSSPLKKSTKLIRKLSAKLYVAIVIRTNNSDPS